MQAHKHKAVKYIASVCYNCIASYAAITALNSIKIK